MLKLKRFVTPVLILMLLFSLSIAVEAVFHPRSDSISTGNAFAQEGVDEEPGSSPDQQSSSAVEPSEVQGVYSTSAAFSGGPSYDSGWIYLGQDESKTLTHNLGGDMDDYVIDMQYRASDVNGINLRYYGGADFGNKPAPGHSEDDRVGAYWRSLNTTNVTVYRRPEDTYAEQVRIRIWIDTGPDYDSGWVALTPGAAATTLNHGLGGNSNNYVVDMQYRSAGDGVNQRYFGGADFGAKAFNGTANNHRVGLYWRTLTNATITLFRRAEDIYADEVRIRIWISPRPTYDSGWVAINQDQAQTLMHNIGGNPDDYLVDMQFVSATNGVNKRHLGGADFGSNPPAGSSENDRVGAYWRSLTDANITIFRRAEDIYAEQVRIRIWNFWKPTSPDYDSNWVGISPDSSVTLDHSVGGSADNYHVDMLYRAPNIDGVNLRYYGGADFGTQPAPGHSAEDRVAAYWRSLTSSTITLFRRAEDTYAPDTRIRIWQMPKPDYDGGWIALGAGAAATTLSHDLGGSVADYFVDMQYRAPDANGINLRYYGGADFGNNPAPGAAENDRVGAYWRSLSTSSITVYRRPDDIYAPEVRVRIWRLTKPDYDSGWFLMTQDAAHTFTHELGGVLEGYLVDMYQWDTDIANTLNQRHLGGADFGNLPPLGYNENDRVGAYWRTLNNDEITVYRRPEDGFSDFVRIRIWSYNKSTFIPITLKD